MCISVTRILLEIHWYARILANINCGYPTRHWLKYSIFCNRAFKHQRSASKLEAVYCLVVYCSVPLNSFKGSNHMMSPSNLSFSFRKPKCSCFFHWFCNRLQRIFGASLVQWWTSKGSMEGQPWDAAILLLPEAFRACPQFHTGIDLGVWHHSKS